MGAANSEKCHLFERVDELQVGRSLGSHGEVQVGQSISIISIIVIISTNTMGRLAASAWHNIQKTRAGKARAGVSEGQSQSDQRLQRISSVSSQGQSISTSISIIVITKAAAALATARSWVAASRCIRKRGLDERI
jgi:nitrate reductase alpha subunit